MIRKIVLLTVRIFTVKNGSLYAPLSGDAISCINSSPDIINCAFRFGYADSVNVASGELSLISCLMAFQCPDFAECSNCIESTDPQFIGGDPCLEAISISCDDQLNWIGTTTLSDTSP